MRLTDDVFQLQQDGIVRLLDFRRGRFVGLDRVGSRMLSLCLEFGREAAVVCVAAEYGIPESRVRHDLGAFVRSLRRKKLLLVQGEQSYGAGKNAARRIGSVLWFFSSLPGLLVRFARRLGASFCGHRRGASAPFRFHAMPSRRRVSCLLTLTWLSLRLFGWTTTLELGRRWHRPPQKNLDTATSAEWIAIVDTIVRDAAAEKLVFPISCKERAMVGYQLLRNAFGFPAEIVLGVQLYPFGLHAWVECYGIIATDNPEHCCMYRPVARYS